MATPFLYRIWVAASALLLPFLGPREIAKLETAGQSTERAREKLGHATAKRPGEGKLIWFHAASVGESLSVLALIDCMGRHLATAHFLITTGTATSAEIISKRLPPRTTHQFAPLDAPAPLRRFLGHWRPDAAVFVESELWPQMLRRTRDTGARMALVNARLSERSLARWRKRPAAARYLMGVFDLILTQNDAMAHALTELKVAENRIVQGVNLKSMSAPLPVDRDALAAAQTALGERPVWVASSTHAGEEESVLQAHRTLLERWPDLCLILAPRHPERGDAVRDLIVDAGLSYTRRTQGDAPGHQVYLADTLGELGLWYALSDIVFLGGSMRPIGGHNPFEVAQAGALALSGNHVTNFAETFSEMEAAGAAQLVADASDLAAKVTALLEDDTRRAKSCAAARAFTAARADMLDDIAARLIRALELTP
ncbi:MAG: 3-deoxy-D-manno-octulosonic acid transferase [Sulfitobacter sp.]